MAKVISVGSSKTAMYDVNGASRGSSNGTTALVLQIGGHEYSWAVPAGSHHEAGYLAAMFAMFAMIHADGLGVTDLVLKTPANFLRNQATGEWRCSAPNLKPLRAACASLEEAFDDVAWLSS